MAVMIDSGHVCLNESSVPIIGGTTTKVVEVVLDHLAYGWSAEEIHFQHPSLSMGQIHAALSYYWDHQAELDADIERRLKRADSLRATSPVNPHIERLRTNRS